MEIELSRGAAETRRRKRTTPEESKRKIDALCASESVSDARALPGVGRNSAAPRLRVQFSANAAQILSIARSWIGTPYVHQASVKGAGCDCLGLLRGVFRELMGGEPETPPPYSPDWAEATGTETLYTALLRHLTEIELTALRPGDVALFRMHPRGPAKHCGIIGCATASLTLIHSRQNKRVSEEPLSAPWRKKLVYSFRL